MSDTNGQTINRCPMNCSCNEIVFKNANDLMTHFQDSKYIGEHLFCIIARIMKIEMFIQENYPNFFNQNNPNSACNDSSTYQTDFSNNCIKNKNLNELEISDIAPSVSLTKSKVDAIKNVQKNQNEKSVAILDQQYSSKGCQSPKKEFEAVASNIMGGMQDIEPSVSIVKLKDAFNTLNEYIAFNAEPVLEDNMNPYEKVKNWYAVSYAAAVEGRKRSKSRNTSFAHNTGKSTQSDSNASAIQNKSDNNVTNECNKVEIKESNELGTTTDILNKEDIGKNEIIKEEQVKNDNESNKLCDHDQKSNNNDDNRIEAINEENDFSLSVEQQNIIPVVENYGNNYYNYYEQNELQNNDLNLQKEKSPTSLYKIAIASYPVLSPSKSQQNAISSENPLKIKQENTPTHPVNKISMTSIVRSSLVYKNSEKLKSVQDKENQINDKKHMFQTPDISTKPMKQCSPAFEDRRLSSYYNKLNMDALSPIPITQTNNLNHNRSSKININENKKKDIDTHVLDKAKNNKRNLTSKNIITKEIAAKVNVINKKSLIQTEETVQLKKLKNELSSLDKMIAQEMELAKSDNLIEKELMKLETVINASKKEKTVEKLSVKKTNFNKSQASQLSNKKQCQSNTITELSDIIITAKSEYKKKVITKPTSNIDQLQSINLKKSSRQGTINKGNSSISILKEVEKTLSDTVPVIPTNITEDEGDLRSDGKKKIIANEYFKKPQDRKPSPSLSNSSSSQLTGKRKSLSRSTSFDLSTTNSLKKLNKNTELNNLKEKNELITNKDQRLKQEKAVQSTDINKIQNEINSSKKIEQDDNDKVSSNTIENVSKTDKKDSVINLTIIDKQDKSIIETESITALPIIVNDVIENVNKQEEKTSDNIKNKEDQYNINEKDMNNSTEFSPIMDNVDKENKSDLDFEKKYLGKTGTETSENMYNLPELILNDIAPQKNNDILEDYKNIERAAQTTVDLSYSTSMSLSLGPNETLNRTHKKRKAKRLLNKIGNGVDIPAAMEDFIKNLAPIAKIIDIPPPVEKNNENQRKEKNKPNNSNNELQVIDKPSVKLSSSVVMNLQVPDINIKEENELKPLNEKLKNNHEFDNNRETIQQRNEEKSEINREDEKLDYVLGKEQNNYHIKIEENNENNDKKEKIESFLSEKKDAMLYSTSEEEEMIQKKILDEKKKKISELINMTTDSDRFDSQDNADEFWFDNTVDITVNKKNEDSIKKDETTGFVDVNMTSSKMTSLPTEMFDMDNTLASHISSMDLNKKLESIPKIQQNQTITEQSDGDSISSTSGKRRHRSRRSRSFSHNSGLDDYKADNEKVVRQEQKLPEKNDFINIQEENIPSSSDAFGNTTITDNSMAIESIPQLPTTGSINKPLPTANNNNYKQNQNDSILSNKGTSFLARGFTNNLGSSITSSIMDNQFESSNPSFTGSTFD